MSTRKGRFDSLFGFLALVAVVAVVWYGGRWVIGRTFPSAPQETARVDQVSNETQKSPQPTARQSVKRRPTGTQDLPPKPLVTAAEFPERLRQYARYCYPPESLDLRLGEPRVQRKGASPSLRRAIFERDGNCCLLCGVKKPLEIDHMCALMNGGDNSPENFATLCKRCNGSAIKTIDNQMKKQREIRLKQYRANDSVRLPTAAEVVTAAINEGVEKTTYRNGQFVTP